MVVGRSALLLWSFFGAYLAFRGVVYIAEPSARDDVVRWRHGALSLALGATGFTRSAQHEHRVVAGAMHIVVGSCLALVAIVGATAAERHKRRFRLQAKAAAADC
jgi:hypothetical protein